MEKIKIGEEKREEIANFKRENPKISHEKISEIFRVHKSVVTRACKKYSHRNL